MAATATAVSRQETNFRIRNSSETWGETQELDRDVVENAPEAGRSKRPLSTTTEPLGRLISWIGYVE
jgi:hypothetical protein